MKPMGDPRSDKADSSDSESFPQVRVHVPLVGVRARVRQKRVTGRGRASSAPLGRIRRRGCEEQHGNVHLCSCAPGYEKQHTGQYTFQGSAHRSTPSPAADSCPPYQGCYPGLFELCSPPSRKGVDRHKHDRDRDEGRCRQSQGSRLTAARSAAQDCECGQGP